MTTHPSPLTPPPVADRRAPNRRTGEQLHVERQEAIRTAVAFAIAVSGGLAIMFVFFAVIGAINFGNAIVATIVAIVLAGVWVGGTTYARRGDRGRHNQYDRERRGF